MPPQETRTLKQQLDSMMALQALGSLLPLMGTELAAPSHHLYDPLPMTLHTYGGVLHPPARAAATSAPPQTQTQTQVLSALSSGLGPTQAQFHTYAPPGPAMPWHPQQSVPSQQPAHLGIPVQTQQPPYNPYINTHTPPGQAAAMPLAAPTGAAAATAAGQSSGQAGADATPPGGQGPGGMWGNYSTQQVQGATGPPGLGAGGGTATGLQLQPWQTLNGPPRVGLGHQQHQQQQGMGRGPGGLFERAWAAPLCVSGCRVVALSPTGGWLLAPETREGGKTWVTKVSVPCPEVRPGFVRRAAMAALRHGGEDRLGRAAIHDGN